jgi:hypothetical protein
MTSEERKQKQKEWCKRSKLKNKEKIKAYKQSEKIRAKNREYARKIRLIDPERFRSACLRWQKKHPEKASEASRKRRALKASVSVDPISSAQLQERLAKFENRCFYCALRGTIGPVEHWDHGTPLSRGGSHTLDNLFPSCAMCNMRKHTKTVLEFIA